MIRRYSKIIGNPMQHNMNEPLSVEEYNVPIGKVTLYKVPGLTGIYPNRFKVLDVEKSYSQYYDIILTIL